jgi:hypothetical protein
VEVEALLRLRLLVGHLGLLAGGVGLLVMSVELPMYLSLGAAELLLLLRPEHPSYLLMVAAEEFVLSVGRPIYCLLAVAGD